MMYMYDNKLKPYQSFAKYLLLEVGGGSMCNTQHPYLCCTAKLKIEMSFHTNNLTYQLTRKDQIGDRICRTKVFTQFFKQLSCMI